MKYIANEPTCLDNYIISTLLFFLGKQLVRHTSFSWQSEIKSSLRSSHTKGLQVLTIPSTPVKWKGALTATREQAIDTPEPFSLQRVIPSRQTQQANNGPPSRESSGQDRERMAVIRLFQFKAPGCISVRVTVGEKEASQQSKQWNDIVVV